MAGRDPPSRPGRSRRSRARGLRPGGGDLGLVRTRCAHRGPTDRAGAVGPAQRDRRRTRARLHRRVCDRRLRHGTRRPALARRAAGLRGAGDHGRWADGVDRRRWIATWSARAERPSAGHAARRRQIDHEARPALGPVGHRDPAAMAIDDPGRDRRGRGRCRRPARPGRDRSARTRGAGPRAGCPGRHPRRPARRRSRPPARRPRPGRRSGCGGWRCRPGS